jgi:CRP-like cAMP-binding protein
MVDIRAFVPKKEHPANIRPEVSKQPDVHLKLDPGEILFSKGELGGDLYFIEQGIVEIFITQKDQEIVLTEMGVGEVIGVMTLLTLEPRLASCRAKEQVIVKKISKASISKLISVLPKWLHIVLKEFTGRITEMNRLYSETLLDLKKARESQVSTLFLAAQMAPTASILGLGLATQSEGSDTIKVQDLLAQLALALNQPREVVADIWQIFVDAGCVHVTSENDKKNPRVALADLVTLATFASFVRESNQGATRKILKAKFSTEDLKLLTDLASLYLQDTVSQDVAIEIKESAIIENLKTKTEVTWDAETIEKSAKAGILTTKGQKNERIISFVPSELSRLAGFLTAFTKFTGEAAIKIVPGNARAGEKTSTSTAKKAA